MNCSQQKSNSLKSLNYCIVSKCKNEFNCLHSLLITRKISIITQDLMKFLSRNSFLIMFKMQKSLKSITAYVKKVTILCLKNVQPNCPKVPCQFLDKIIETEKTFLDKNEFFYQSSNGHIF